MGEEGIQGHLSQEKQQEQKLKEKISIARVRDSEEISLVTA